MEASSQPKLKMKGTPPRRCQGWIVKHCRRATSNRIRCPRCQHQWYRDTHPLRYAFDNLRNRARQRGHSFTLTYEKYEQLALDSGWTNERRGRHPESLSINRIKSELGYSDDNVEVMAYGENSRIANIGRKIKDAIRGALSDSDKADTDDNVQLPFAQPWDMNAPF